MRRIIGLQRGCGCGGQGRDMFLLLLVAGTRGDTLLVVFVVRRVTAVIVIGVGNRPDPGRDHGIDLSSRSSGQAT